MWILRAARLKNADHTLQELRQLSDNDLANIVYDPAPEVAYPDNARRLDFTDWIPGVYFISVKNKKDVRQGKLVEVQ